MDRVSIYVALSGSRVMPNEDLSAGFTNFQRLQARDRGFQTSVSKAVLWNADLLNKLVTRANTLEASAALVTSEVSVALDGVSDLNIARDKQLRDELDAMAKKLESGFERLAGAASTAQPATSTEGGSARLLTAFKPSCSTLPRGFMRSSP